MHSNLSVAAMRRAAEVSMARNSANDSAGNSPESPRMHRLPLPGKSAAERERERERAQRVRQMMKTGAAVRAMAQTIASNAHVQQNGFVVETLGPDANVAVHARSGVDIQRHEAATGFRKEGDTRTDGRSKLHIGAGQFLARAQQLISGKRRDDNGYPNYATGFAAGLRDLHPPTPPNLVRGIARKKHDLGPAKMKVILRICPTPSGSLSSIFQADAQRRHVTVHDPTVPPFTPAHLQQKLGAALNDKVFGFDSVMPPDASQSEVCSAVMTDLLKAVVQGHDSCVFTYGFGPSKYQGKTYTMMGEHTSSQLMGLLPSALSWLFTVIPLYQQRTGEKLAVSVSALQLRPEDEMFDLLLEALPVAAHQMRPVLEIREDPELGTQVANLSKLPVNSAQQAGHYLDIALAAHFHTNPHAGAHQQSTSELHTHFVFTIHLLHMATAVEKEKESRLHFVDLAALERLGTMGGDRSAAFGTDLSVTLSLTALGNVILALMANAKHVPYRDCKLMRLLRDSLGNNGCRTTIVAHVSSCVSHYKESLATIQLAARMHRLKRRKNRYSGTSSSGGESSEADTAHSRSRRAPAKQSQLAFRQQHQVTSAQVPAAQYSSVLSDSDVGGKPRHSGCDYNTSAAEDSCDTVIYTGPGGHPLSDCDLTDGEGPPRLPSPPPIHDLPARARDDPPLKGSPQAPPYREVVIPPMQLVPTPLPQHEVCLSRPHLNFLPPLAEESEAPSLAGSVSQLDELSCDQDQEQGGSRSELDLISKIADSDELGTRPQVPGQSCSSGSEGERSPIIQRNDRMAHIQHLPNPLPPPVVPRRTKKLPMSPKNASFLSSHDNMQSVKASSTAMLTPGIQNAMRYGNLAPMTFADEVCALPESLQTTLFELPPVPQQPPSEIVDSVLSDARRSSSRGQDRLHGRHATNVASLATAPQHIIDKWQREANSESNIRPVSSREPDTHSHMSFGSCSSGVMGAASSVCSSAGSPNYLSSLLGRSLDSVGVFANSEGFLTSPLTPGVGSTAGSIESMHSSIATCGSGDRPPIYISTPELHARCHSGGRVDTTSSGTASGIATPTIPNVPLYSFEETAAQVARSLIEKLRQNSGISRNLSNSISALEEATRTSLIAGGNRSSTGNLGRGEMHCAAPPVKTPLRGARGHRPLGVSSPNGNLLPNVGQHFSQASSPTGQLVQHRPGSSQNPTDMGSPYNVPVNKAQQTTSPGNESQIDSDGGVRHMGEDQTRSKGVHPSMTADSRREQMPASPQVQVDPRPAFTGPGKPSLQKTVGFHSQKQNMQSPSTSSLVPDTEKDGDEQTSFSYGLMPAAAIKPSNIQQANSTSLANSVDLPLKVDLLKDKPVIARKRNNSNDSGTSVKSNQSRTSRSSACKAVSALVNQQQHRPTVESTSAAVGKRAAQPATSNLTPLTSPVHSDASETPEEALVRLAQKTTADMVRLSRIDDLTSPQHNTDGSVSARASAGGGSFDSGVVGDDGSSLKSRQASTLTYSSASEMSVKQQHHHQQQQQRSRDVHSDDSSKKPYIRFSVFRRSGRGYSTDSERIGKRKSDRHTLPASASSRGGLDGGITSAGEEMDDTDQEGAPSSVKRLSLKDRLVRRLRRKKKETNSGDVTWTQLGLFPPPPSDDHSAASAPASYGRRVHRDDLDDELFISSHRVVRPAQAKGAPSRGGVIDQCMRPAPRFRGIWKRNSDSNKKQFVGTQLNSAERESHKRWATRAFARLRKSKKKSRRYAHRTSGCVSDGNLELSEYEAEDIERMQRQRRRAIDAMSDPGSPRRVHRPGAISKTPASIYSHHSLHPALRARSRLAEEFGRGHLGSPSSRVRSLSAQDLPSEDLLSQSLPGNSKISTKELDGELSDLHSGQSDQFVPSSFERSSAMTADAVFFDRNKAFQRWSMRRIPDRNSSYSDAELASRTSWRNSSLRTTPNLSRTRLTSSPVVSGRRNATLTVV